MDGVSYSAGARSRPGFIRGAVEQAVEAGRDLGTEAGSPKRRDNPSKYVHGVMRAQNQHRGHFKTSNQDRNDGEPLSVQHGKPNRTESCCGSMSGEEKMSC